MSSKDYFTQAAVANRFTDGFNKSFENHLNTVVSHKNAVEQAKIWRENMSLQNETARLRNRMTEMELDAYERSQNAPASSYTQRGNMINEGSSQTDGTQGRSLAANAGNTNPTSSNPKKLYQFSEIFSNDINFGDKTIYEKPYIGQAVAENKGGVNIDVNYENIFVDTENGNVTMSEYKIGNDLVKKFSNTYGSLNARSPLLYSDDLQDLYVNTLANSYYKDDQGNTTKFSDSELFGGPNLVIRERLAQQIAKEANAAGINVTPTEVLDGLAPITDRNQLATFQKDLAIRKQLKNAIENQYQWWGGRVAGWFGDDVDQSDVLSAIDETMSKDDRWNSLDDVSKGYQVTKVVEGLRRETGNAYWGFSQGADMDVQGIKDYAVHLITKNSGKNVKTVEEYNRNLIDAVDSDDIEYLDKISMLGPDGVRKVFINDQWLPLGDLGTDDTEGLRTSNMLPAQQIDRYQAGEEVDRSGLLNLVPKPGKFEVNPESALKTKMLKERPNLPPERSDYNRFIESEKPFNKTPLPFIDLMRQQEETRNSNGEQPPRI